MKLAFKQVLANLLIFTVMMLPLSAAAMPMDMSSDHCMGDMTGDMSELNYEMPTIDEDGKQAVNCQCCEQCVGDCNDCASMSVVVLELLQFSDIKNHEVFVVTTDLLFTHITSPPSKPPQILTL
jgi:hypothetical protein